MNTTVALMMLSLVAAIASTLRHEVGTPAADRAHRALTATIADAGDLERAAPVCLALADALEELADALDVPAMGVSQARHATTARGRRAAQYRAHVRNLRAITARPSEAQR